MHCGCCNVVKYFSSVDKRIQCFIWWIKRFLWLNDSQNFILTITFCRNVGTCFLIYAKFVILHSFLFFSLQFEKEWFLFIKLISFLFFFNWLPSISFLITAITNYYSQLDPAERVCQRLHCRWALGTLFRRSCSTRINSPQHHIIMKKQ